MKESIEPPAAVVVLSRREIYSGRVLRLEVDEIREPGGTTGIREVVRHSGSVAALAVHGDGSVVLVRQYRHPVDEQLWELPAGILDPGESPRRSGPRAGGGGWPRAERLEPLADFYTTPGFCDETMHVFRATRLTDGAAAPRVGRADRGEDMPSGGGTRDDPAWRGARRQDAGRAAARGGAARAGGRPLSERRRARRRSMPFVRSAVLEVGRNAHRGPLRPGRGRSLHHHARALRRAGRGRPFAAPAPGAAAGTAATWTCPASWSGAASATTPPPGGPAAWPCVSCRRIPRCTAGSKSSRPWDSGRPRRPLPPNTTSIGSSSAATVDVADLNRFGRDGWQLVTIIPSAHGFKLILTRRL